MSLWDASELDQVGGDREVIPSFINLTDAAIHMVCFLTAITVTRAKYR
jgi:CCR4-NOT transcriptional complex subunit CAF120